MFLPTPPPARPTLLAHYMPWYASKPVSGAWGWHWTMNRFDPEKTIAGRVEAASHYRPLMGLYDSGDPAAIECHLLLMKMAGIDGVLVDWYGNVDTYDYATIHRNTGLVLAACARLGMKFALVYEDQTVPQLVKNGRFRAEDAVAAGQKLMTWLGRNWFASPAYLKEEGRPVFLVFGPQYYKGEEWTRLFSRLSQTPVYYSLHTRKPPAAGAYDWPLPNEAEAARARFYAARKDTPNSIPVAYPRFHDIYREAGAGEGYGEIPDADGATYTRTLTEALESGARFVQIATWNDWGEGTVIEPSSEYGTRDLETTARLRGRKVTPADLRLPLRLYAARKRFASDPKRGAELDRPAAALGRGEIGVARRQLDLLPR